MVAVRAPMIVVGTIGWPFFFSRSSAAISRMPERRSLTRHLFRGICSAHVWRLRLREGLEWCGWPEQYLSLDGCELLAMSHGGAGGGGYTRPRFFRSRSCCRG
jgi:hypothetical protein